MKRRDFLLVSGSVRAATPFASCAPSFALRAKIASLDDLMTARVIRDEFPGAVWLVSHDADEPAAVVVGQLAFVALRKPTLFCSVPE